MPKILHITAHLGGGVGKVLSRLVEESSRRKDTYQHFVACLEEPEKTGFAAHIAAHGGELLICPPLDVLERHIATADIVQLEWWHHPFIANWLGSTAPPPMRLLVWSHVSGLYPPVIPPAFVALPHRFLFSSPCSEENPELSELPLAVLRRLGTVFSSGGFNDLPPPKKRPRCAPLRIGYVGTLNFSKLHPQLMDYLAAINLPGFSLALLGDPTTGEQLMTQATARGIADRIDLRGYKTDIAAELAELDILVYLLNPLHYGTTENALLEAMAMGVVPIVLDNPAERHLIRDGENGLIVNSPANFARAIERLATSPEERTRLASSAAQEVRERFSVERTGNAMRTHYEAVLGESKRLFDFTSVFGDTPSDWFLSCQGNERWRFKETGEVCLDGNPPHFLFERTKSSAIHFSNTFPNDRFLASWKQQLETK